MVQSNLNATVTYKDDLQLNHEDIGYQSSQYEIELFEKLFIIALGKPKYEFQKKNIVYYPIYLVNDDIIRGQIGVYEVDSNELINLLDEDNDLDLSKIGEPILYEFINEPVLSKLIEKRYTVESDTSKPKPETQTSQEIITIDDESSEEEDDDDDDVTKLRRKDGSILVSNSILTEKGLFTIDPNAVAIEPLSEETEKEAQEMKKKYIESSSNVWIQKFCKNNDYSIIDNEGGGDCFFAVIRDAFSQIGYNITVQRMRDALSAQVTDEIYQQHRTIYLSLHNEIVENNKKMNDIRSILKILEKRSKSTDDKQQKGDILNDARKQKTLYEKLKDENVSNAILMKDFADMININSFDEFREFIKTRHFWADTWAISKLEELLNIKVIILSELAYNNGALDSVMNCGETNRDIEERGSFEPKYYVITSYSGDHYKLVAYKRKQVFTFREIPYDIKIMITNKCLERNSGVFYMIQDFRNLKSKLGIHPDEGRRDEEEEFFDVELFNPSIVFMFHGKSEDKPKPGKGTGEEIPADKMIDFIELMRNKANTNWRRKLDDTWTESPFVLDNLRWYSVEHYLLASQYKKGYPDFYKIFSQDSQSDISKDIVLAKATASKTGKLKDKQLRPKEVKPDSDYEQRKIEERRLALTAKFTQNIDLLELLKYTYPAKLTHFQRGSPAETDKDLMQLRKNIIANK